MPDRRTRATDLALRIKTREWTTEELLSLLEDARAHWLESWEDEAARDAEKMLREMDGFAEMG